MFFQSVLDSAIGHVEDEHSSISRPNSNVISAITKSSSRPIAAYVELVISVIIKKSFYQLVT